MDIAQMFDPNEKPLETLLPDGGFCGIFRTIGCIGDSLSSGAFETLSEDNVPGGLDMYEYSWGQFMARIVGNTVYNFSRGGMTAKEYCESFADQNGFWPDKTFCQGYVIALGVNDALNPAFIPFGSREYLPCGNALQANGNDGGRDYARY